MRRYNPKEIEAKWQKAWEDSGIYATDTTKSDKKFYVIPMFPYPSGDLHVGHWYNFAPTDAIARWRRMSGHEVLHANGFDAFGLPAENAAIKRGIAPAEWTYGNIASMTKQLKAIGASYDWSRQLVTCQPEYYRWTQWLFVKLYEKGLAYKKKGIVNWCPKDQTVLANEQVVGENNECERCGTPVEQKELEQWYFKITDYADGLLDDIGDVDWPERVKTMQANWIGRSKGAEIDFAVEATDQKIKVFTTRPDTLFGATYMVLAPEHPLVLSITTDAQRNEVTSYIQQTLRQSELDRQEGAKDKTGVFTGAYAINPVNDEKIPVWIADYVLTTYGTGAIMAVPAHDERDFEFATKFKLPIIRVVQNDAADDECTHAEGTMINSGEYDGLPSQEMREKIVADLAGKHIATEHTNYRLRDWLISRQRYWGAPIPIVYCDQCGIVPVPEDQLPVVLPEHVAFTPTGQSPLHTNDAFVRTTCPKCHGAARRETDTMDTFVDSSWYFLRYPDPSYDTGSFNPAVLKKWGPVDHYIGGIEHAILHLLYARFITKFLADHHGLAFREPFKKLSNQGIILGPDGQKMSKSRGNVISPDDQVASYGADSLRLYLMFMGPYDQGGPYSMGGIAGTRRFLDRLWLLVQEYADAKTSDSFPEEDCHRITAKTIKKVTEDLHTMSFNTAIAALMEAVNELYRLKTKHPVSKAQPWNDTLCTIVQLVAPFAPHITEEMWHDLGHTDSVHKSAWPVHDEQYLLRDTITIVVQVNGKVRTTLSLPTGSLEAAVVAAAKADAKVADYLDGQTPKKTIYVPGKLVNLVV